ETVRQRLEGVLRSAKLRGVGTRRQARTGVDKHNLALGFLEHREHELRQQIRPAQVGSILRVQVFDGSLLYAGVRDHSSGVNQQIETAKLLLHCGSDLLDVRAAGKV